MSIDEAIGTTVHEMMWRQRVKQRLVYQAMGLSRSALAKKLRGEIAWSAGDVLVTAQVLGVHPGDLYPTEATILEWAPRGSNPQPTDSRVRHLRAVA